MEKWQIGIFILILLLFSGLAIVMSEQSSANIGLKTEASATCPAAQFATGENASGAFQCSAGAAQTAVSTEVAAGCPVNQFVTTESANGGLGCATALTTQTAVSTEVAGGCSTLDLYATTESANGNINCARVNQGFNQTGLTLYAQLDEGSGSIIYDLSKNHFVGASKNNPAWLNSASCIFQQYCLNFSRPSAQTVNLGHIYNDTGNNPVSMCVWDYPAKLQVNPNNNGIFGDSTLIGGQTSGYLIAYINSSVSHTPQFQAQRSASGSSQNAHSSTENSPINNWYFVCLGYNNPVLSLYVNGILHATVNMTNSIPVTLQTMSNYTLGLGGPTGSSYNDGRESTFFQFNYGLTNSTALALYEYVPNPTEQNPILWQQLTGFPANCAAGQFVIGITTTLSCATALTTQTAVSTELASGCPANQFATTEDLGGNFGCAGVTTESAAGCANANQYVTTESANGGLGCDEVADMKLVTNSTTCTDITSGVAHMMGLQVSYTPKGTGNISLDLTFQLSTPATTAINTKWQFAFGTGTEPVCNAVATGTTAGNQYEVGTFAGVAAFEVESIGVVITGQTPGTRLWFDVQATDSTGASWIYSNPTLSVVET